MGQTPVEQDETLARTSEQERLAPEEEREARALAEEFFKRLEQAQDVTPLVKELYVSDFVARMQQDDMGGLFPLAVTPEVAAEATPDETLRLYAASINVMYLSLRLYIAAYLKQRQKPRDEQASVQEEKIAIEEIIPPAIIKLIQSDPVLARLLAKELQQEAARNVPVQETDETNRATESTDIEAQNVEPQSFEDLVPFKTTERMRHYLSLTEQGLDLIREHLKTLPPELTPSVKDFYLKEQMKDAAGKGAEKQVIPKFVTGIEAHTLDSEYMGYPKGMRLICIQTLIHMEITRTPDGTLKIVKVSLLVD
jgi:hypothetical protein